MQEACCCAGLYWRHKPNRAPIDKGKPQFSPLTLASAHATQTYAPPLQQLLTRQDAAVRIIGRSHILIVMTGLARAGVHALCAGTHHKCARNFDWL